MKIFETFAPIALFVYKRPEHVMKAIESLINNKEFYESKLYIFSDGPRSLTDEKAVHSVRDLIRSMLLPNVVLVERELNLGLANSIISGVDQLCEKYGRVIVLEDDLITSPFFLNYMNQALNRYEEDDQVMQISGHMFPVDLPSSSEAVFLPFITSWGWATWKRAWQFYDHTMKDYEKICSNPKMRRKFDLDGNYPYFHMAKKQKKGKIDSWAIRWNISVFMRNGLVLYPRMSLIRNCGFDGSGTHCTNNNFYDLLTNCPIEDLPSAKIDEESFMVVKKYLGEKNCFIARVKKSLMAKFKG